MPNELKQIMFIGTTQSLCHPIDQNRRRRRQSDSPDSWEFCSKPGEVMSINRKNTEKKINAYSNGTNGPSDWNFDLQHWRCNRAHATEEIEPWLNRQCTDWTSDLMSLQHTPDTFIRQWEINRLAFRTKQLEVISAKLDCCILRIQKKMVVKIFTNAT